MPTMTAIIPASEVGKLNTAFRRSLPFIDWKGKLVVTPGVAAAFKGHLSDVIRRVIEFPDHAFYPEFDPEGNRDLIVLDTMTPPIMARIDEVDSGRVLTVFLPDEY